MPTEVEKPSSAARRAMVSASSGFFMPAPTTLLMLTWKRACSARCCSFLSSVLRLFCETSSGVTLSIEICRYSRPASLSRSMRSVPEIEAVGDEPGQHAAIADAADDGVELGMHHRLAAGDGHDAGAQLAQAVDAHAASSAAAPGPTSCRTRCSRRRRGCSGAWGRSAPGSGARCRASPTLPSAARERFG